MLKFLLIFLLGVSVLKAQSLDKARSIIDTLCSQEMFGRGYTKEGHQKAANYISSAFESRGLKSFGSNYQQTFPLKVNTFPNPISFRLDQKELSLGKDYIIAPASKSFNGKLEVEQLPLKALRSIKKLKKFLAKHAGQKALLIDFRELNKEERKLASQLSSSFAGYPVVLMVDSVKLTASMSQSESRMTVFKLKVDNDFRIPQELEIKVENKLKDVETSNVLAYIEGNEYPDSFVVFSAHYDHLGGYGDSVYFPGANDNASGIAMLLELADEFQKMDSLKYSVAFIAFGGEEVGLIGSKYYTENPLFPLSSIKALINTDILGTGDEGIKMVNATENMGIYNAFVSLNEKLKLLKYVGKRGPAANSDHYFFSLKNVPAVFIYTLGGVSAYHDVYDIPSTLPLTAFLSIKKLLLSYFLTL